MSEPAVLNVTTDSPEATKAWGEALGRLAQPGDLLLLVGDVGTGKTCFTQGLARGLEVRQPILSPTFVLVREYRGRLPLYHVDLYRLSFDDAADLGLDDYLQGDGLCVVEWAERAAALFPEENLTVHFTYLDEQRRALRFEATLPRYQARLEALRTWAEASRPAPAGG